MNHDTLANTMSAVLCYERASKKEIILHPISKIIRQVLDIMNKHSYIGQYEEITSAKGGFVKLNLLGSINKCGVIKPRFAVSLNEFTKFEKRYLPAEGVGIIIISTAQGLMTLSDAREKKIGGRLIAYCY